MIRITTPHQGVFSTNRAGSPRECPCGLPFRVALAQKKKETPGQSAGCRFCSLPSLSFFRRCSSAAGREIIEPTLKASNVKPKKGGEAEQIPFLAPQARAQRSGAQRTLYSATI